MAHIVLSQIAQASVNNVPLTQGYYDQLFIHGPAFADMRNASIVVTSPSCGPSGSNLGPEFTAEGDGRFPDLHWESSLDRLMEYLLVIEDPDAPLPQPLVHAIYYDIDPETNGITDDELHPKPNAKFDNVVEGGFRYGKNYGDNIYVVPNPPPGTPHRYFYEVIALKEKLDLDEMSDMPSIDEMASAIMGKVAGWGAWMGVVEKE